MRICIGTITRNRKIGLKQLVESYCRMTLPANCEIIFAVVENDTDPSVADIVRPLQALGELHYEMEPQLGIPFARNHVLDISLRENCDFTTFVDDDETVATDWLIAIIENMQSRNLDLIGGCVKLHKCDDAASALNRCIWRGVEQWFGEISSSADELYEKGHEHLVWLATNNWMVRNEFLVRSGIRFDESLGLSSGSDTVFFHSATLIGARTGWAPDAVVFETMPLSRLTPKYQYERGRDQTIAASRHQRTSLTVNTLTKAAVFIVKKLGLSIYLFLAAPFTRFMTTAMAFRNLGVAAGEFKGIIGYKANHYKNIHKI